MLTRNAGFTGKLLFILIILVLNACGGDGGTMNGTVTGLVSDITTGAPLSGVSINVGSTTVVTDADGVFTLVRPAGSYTITATAKGYEQTSRVCRVPAGSTITFNVSLTPSHASYVDYDGVPLAEQIPAASMDYVILAWNDLGMHCAQDDYSYFLILPPFNTLHVQVIQRGVGVVTTGITVHYAFPNKTNSALHTNFWNYADNYQYFTKYGWDETPNIGITGTPLSGDMKLDDNGVGFVATGIPITPYDDDGTWNPYGTAAITVTDNSTGDILATASVVAPISTELNCSNCHGNADPFLNILKAHDKNSGTTLVADRSSGILHLCAECHADNALGLSGKSGVKNLSLAMHGFHKDKMNVSADPKSPDCYNCHPGPLTKCLRGKMFHAGQECKDCHGDMQAMATALQAGRKPWLQEPRCGDCHDAKYQENPGTLYRNSFLTNSPDPKMNGQIYCEGCHNSTHAEFGSTNPVDNGIPQQFQGDSYWIWNCYVCHTDYMPMPAHM